jgi:rubrerythrin
MIIQSNTSHHPTDIDKEGAIQAVMSLLKQREPVSVLRWFCNVCGMIHLGATPLACESCGHEVLTQQADSHCEMNSRW